MRRLVAPVLVTLLCALGGIADAAPAPKPVKSAKGKVAQAKKKPGKPVAKTRPKAGKPKAVARPTPPRPANPEILFTFDDGPSLERTPKVLDTLDKHGIKAVFFVNGVHFEGKSKSAERAREILRDITRRGHYVGNHTVHHLFLCGKRGPTVAGYEISHNADLIEQATGIRPELYRTPFGAHCPTLSATLAQLDTKHTGWDIDPQDWKVRNTEIVRDRVIAGIRAARGRTIVLMHDIHQCTVEALPQILDWLAAENKARAQRKEPLVRVIDYSSMLRPRPVIPPLLDNLGRVLIDAAPPSARRLWNLAAAARPPEAS